MAYRHFEGPAAVVRRKARSWQSRPRDEKLWVAPALVALGLSRAALHVFPFRCIAPFLGRDLRTAATVPPADTAETTRALHIGRALRTAVRYTPWDSTCLAQAMAARVLLGACRVPYALFLGVAREHDGGVSAHAWVRSGPVDVTGGRGSGRYTVVATFVSAGRPK